MSERIRWTPEEKEKLFTAALPMLQQNPALAVINALRSVQDGVLPSDRTRSLQNKNAIPPDLLERLETARGEQRAFVPVDEHGKVVESLRAAEAERDEAKGRIDRLTEELRQAKVEITTLRNQPKPQPNDEVVKAFFADILGRAMAQARFGGMPSFGSGTQSQVDRRSHPRHDPEATSESRQPRPKVIVVGPIREQAISLKEEYGELVDLRIYTSDEYERASADALSHAAKIVVWTKFVSHTAQNRAPKDKTALAHSFLQVKEEIEKVALK